MKKSIHEFPEGVVDHLQPHFWELANRQHLAKAISEFAHEWLIQPEFIEADDFWKWYSLKSSLTGATYKFRAKLKVLYHWKIDEKSICKINQEHQTEVPDSLSFINEFYDKLGIDKTMLPVYLEEITATLYARCYSLYNSKFTAKQLIAATYQDVEHAMIEGHPVFVANNGRIGYDSADYLAYTPEAKQHIQLIWIAGHKSRATFKSISSITYESLLREELDEITILKFNSILRKKNLTPDDYIFMPVHPWQWFNKLSSVFASDIALQKMICLGNAPDHYYSQQAIRTFYNASHSEKRFVKTALSILNMGFMRGLSPYYMETTPDITQWLEQTLGNDLFLKEKGFEMLGEVATIGYRNLNYEHFGKSLAHNKMLACLWRENPVSKLKEGAKFITMAALLHKDVEGNAFLPELIKQSGLPTEKWIQQYLDIYLSPLLHCFYYYDIAFMPHGENIFLVLENNIPLKAYIKDLTEETVVFNEELPLPEKVKRLQLKEDDNIRIQSLLSDIVDCFFRFLSDILDDNGFPETQFWSLVADCILNYQKRFPELKDKFSRFDLFVPDFLCCCLNRLQLKNNLQMLDLADPSKSFQMVGLIQNPIAYFNPKRQKKVTNFYKMENS